MLAEDALLAAQDMARFPAMPAPLAALLLRHNVEAADRRFAAAALTMAEVAEMLAVLADGMPPAALVPARAWALMRLEQYGAVGIPPGLPRALLRGLVGPREGSREGPETALGRAAARQAFREQVWEGGLARVPLLPLGLNCLPWNLPARWGFRAGPEALAAMTPFALAAHQMPVVLAALEAGWAGYAPAGALRAIATPGTTPGATRAARGSCCGRMAARSGTTTSARAGRPMASPRCGSTSKSSPGGSSGPVPRRGRRCGCSSW